MTYHRAPAAPPPEVEPVGRGLRDDSPPASPAYPVSATATAAQGSNTAPVDDADSRHNQRQLERGRALTKARAEEAAKTAEESKRRAEESKRRAEADKEAARARKVALAKAERARQKRILNRPAPPPPPQPYGVSHAGAEALVVDWMRHLGVLDAEATRTVKDGGIDVDSATYVAQVKNYQGSVGVSEVRELYGVSHAIGKKPLLFTSGTLTGDASAFVSQVGIPVIRYSAEQGTVTGLNPLGSACVEFGIVESYENPPS